jgi:protoporphyrinogen oxidase
MEEPMHNGNGNGNGPHSNGNGLHSNGNGLPARVEFVVVGAGVAGLTVAHQLAKMGRSVVVIERGDRVGGLAKSFFYEVEGRTCIFDTGPKRFHTEDPEVHDFIVEVLANQYLEIGRASSVYLFGRYFGWPLSTRDVFKLPVSIQLRVGVDLMRKAASRQVPARDDRFESYILNQYGPTLYRSFFKGYTEKFTGIPAAEVHEDWATTGINRSIIDKNAKGNSIFELARSVLLPPALKTVFLYPKERGFGNFSERLALGLVGFGGTILTQAMVSEIDGVGQSIVVDGQRVGFSRLIWTGNLHDLGMLLGERFNKLQYLSTIFYNIVTRRRPKRDDQWIYYGDSDLEILRVSIVNNFAPYLIPEPFGGLIVEKTCRHGDAVWENPERRRAQLIDELIRVRLIDDPSDIVSIATERVRDTYPVYHMDYRKGFSEIAATVKRSHPFVTLLGRTGAFWYNNSDHSIKIALGLARYLAGKQTVEPDKDRVFSAEVH